MAEPKPTPNRGLLRQGGAQAPFELVRFPARTALEDLVEDYWIVRWDLAGQPAHPQEVLTHPSVTLAVDAGQSGVFGVVTGRFVRRLEERGRAVGVKFWPGAYTALHGRGIEELTDVRLDLEQAFGAAGAELEAAVLGTQDDRRIVALLEDFLLERRGPLSAEARKARAVAQRIADDPSLSRVDQVAEVFGLGVRALQRLTRECVGVSPKWLIQRARLHEALARLEAGEGVDLAALAAELGYCDQAHFAREFARLVGRPPGAYARGLRDE